MLDSGQARPDGLRERKKARTRASIREHALRLFREQGYHATTVEKIAEAAEISPSTFFRYFPTKEDLVLQDEIFLGREVPEERARRDLGRLGDLLHRGGVVALLAEQPERVLPDGSTRPGLLPLAQAVRPGLAGVEHVRHTSNCARSASSSPRSAAPTRGAPVIPSGRRGRKMTARTALTSAMPPQAHSIVSMPWTNAVRTEPSRAAEPTSRATPTPATTLLLASAAADAGRPLSARWPR